MVNLEARLRKAVGGESPEKFKIMETGIARMFSVYLNDEIGEPAEYTRLVSLFRSASPYDHITMYINSPGGNLQAGLQLISAMNDCQATIVTVLDGIAMSLAPIILFAGKEIIINDDSMMMFHDYSGGFYGKGSENFSSSAAWNRLYKQLLTSYAYPFLSKDEIDRICSGQDFYFGTDEVRKRLEAIVAQREEQKNAAEEKKPQKAIPPKKARKKNGK
jgi:ATP-dependent Clp protease protease subunit